MVTAKDNDYKLTKLIKQGKARMCADFEPLADWISTTYGYKPINILYEKINNGRITPRLEIVFEDSPGFYHKESFANYDEGITNAISRKFEEFLIKAGLNRKRNVFAWLLSGRSKYDLENLFVVFSQFKQIARIEANEKVSGKEIKKLKQQFDNNDLWEIVQGFSSVIFFFYQEEQIQKNIDNGFRNLATSGYFELLKKYDEFDYFQESEFSVSFDSKENLDKNYDGNFYYYFK